MIPTGTEISYFLEMHELGHFTQAAAKLRISQSALTQSISKLESKIGAPLFYRSKKGCVPTEAGHLFYRQAQQLLENWNQLSKSIAQQQTSVSGKFRLGCHPSLGVYALPPLLKSLKQKAPGIEIVLAHDFSQKLASQVISYELDLAFVVNPEQHPELILNRMHDDRICLWKSKKNKEIPEYIFTDMGVSEVRAFFGKRNQRFQDWSITESTSLELIRALVSEGLGVGILPERVAKLDRNLELFDSNLPTSRDEIYAIYRSDTLKTSAGRLLREVVRGCF